MNAMARPATLFLCAASAALPLHSNGPDRHGEPQLRYDLIVVQIPVDAPRAGDATARSLPLAGCVDGARIVRVDSTGSSVEVLTADFVGACDPDVSFDGKTIVFAGKQSADDSWQIWLMNTDGSGKIPITHGSDENFGPVFAGARFYLDDPQPTPQILFARRAGRTGAFALYGTDTEGATLHRVTFNPQSDFSAAVLPTGRVVFSSRQGSDDPLVPGGHVALLAVNIDGTDLMPFYGNHEAPRYKGMASVAPTGQRVYFVESDRLSWLGGGNLASVSWRRPLSTYRQLAGDADGGGVYHSPAPLPDGGLLASYRGSDAAATFVVYRLDPESGTRMGRVFGQAGWHSIDTHVLAPRRPVPGRSNWLKPGATSGVFYCLNSYRTNLGEGPEPSVASPGSIRHVRVIEAEPRRILGIAPVEPDGSFHIRVPAETPITFQLLDRDYVALRTQRAWTWVMGNENRGCIGCHEDRELAPPNRLATAITKPPVDLTLPPARRRTVDFRHEIAPIVAARCATARCHTADGAQPVLGASGSAMSEAMLRTAYAALLQPSPGRADGPFVVPGRARASPLVRLLLGRDGNSRPNAGAGHDVLEQRELIQMIEWVDMGATWDAQPADTGSAP